MKRRIIATFALLAILAASGPVTFAGRKEAEITKVKYYHMKPGQRIETSDQMIRFEQRYYLYGAVTDDEFVEKFGNYYTIFFKAPSSATPVTVRFEYRQSLTGPKIHTLESTVDKLSGFGSTESRFRITGEAYLTNGPVVAWKASLLVDGQVVSESKSFLWQ